jgi:hypothetical protein
VCYKRVVVSLRMHGHTAKPDVRRKAITAIAERFGKQEREVVWDLADRRAK